MQHIIHDSVIVVNTTDTLKDKKTLQPNGIGCYVTTEQSMKKDKTITGLTRINSDEIGGAYGSCWKHENAYRVLVGKERDLQEDLDIAGEIILKWIV